jgi:hypothetical protein
MSEPDGKPTCVTDFFRLICGYYWLVIRRASIDTYLAFGFWNLAGPAILGGIGWGAHVLIVRFHPSFKQLAGDPMAQGWSVILYVLAPMGTVSFCLWLIRLSLAGPLIHREQRIEIQKQRSLTESATNENSVLRDSHFAKLAQVRQELESGFANERGTLNTRLQEIADKRTLGKELSEFMRFATRSLLPGEQGRNINQGRSQEEYPKFLKDFEQLKKDEDEWVKQVSAWLTEKLPHHAAGFEDYGVIINSHLDEFLGEQWRPEYKTFVIRMNRRMAYLKSIAAALDGTK